MQIGSDAGVEAANVLLDLAAEELAKTVRSSWLKYARLPKVREVVTLVVDDLMTVQQGVEKLQSVALPIGEAHDTILKAVVPAIGLQLDTIIYKADEKLVQAAIEAVDTSFIQETKEVLALIKKILTDAITSDSSVGQVMRSIRKLIGLTPLQAQRADKVYKGVVDSGGSVAAATKARDQYTERLIKQRSKVIARTELARAQSHGQQAVWEDLVRKGVIDPSTTRKKWITAKDEKVCPICGPMQGVTADVFGSWTLPNTAVVKTPTDSHIQCRCGMVLDVDDIDMSKAYAQTAYEGAMLAAYFDAPERLAVAGGISSDELHVTLCYLGPDAGLTPMHRELAQEALRSVLAGSGPIETMVTGLDFLGSAESETAVVLLLAQTDALMTMQAMLKQRLDTFGVPRDRKYPQYKPHVTLGVWSREEAVKRFIPGKYMEGYPLVLDRFCGVFGSSKSAAIMKAGFDPSQPRDGYGRWTAGGYQAINPMPPAPIPMQGQQSLAGMSTAQQNEPGVITYINEHGFERVLDLNGNLDDVIGVEGVGGDLPYYDIEPGAMTPDQVRAFLNWHDNALDMKGIPVILRMDGEGAGALVFANIDGTWAEIEMSEAWLVNLDELRHNVNVDGGWALSDPVNGMSIADYEGVDIDSGGTVWADKVGVLESKLETAAYEDLQGEIDSFVNSGSYGQIVDIPAGAGEEAYSNYIGSMNADELASTLIGVREGSDDWGGAQYDWASDNAEALGITWDGDSGEFLPAGSLEGLADEDDYQEYGEREFTRQQGEVIQAGVSAAVGPLGFEASTSVTRKSVSIQIMENGYSVGSYSFEIDGGGIYLAYANLDASVQGRGLSSAMYTQLLPIVESTGSKSLRMNANIQNGAYTWSRMGFLPSDEYQLQKAQNTVRYNMGQDEWKSFVTEEPVFGAAVDNFLKADDPRAIWDFVDTPVRRPSGHAASAEIMYGVSFDASIDLTDREQAERLYGKFGLEYELSDDGRYVPKVS